MASIVSRRQLHTPLGELSHFDMVVVTTLALLVAAIGLTMTFGMPADPGLRVAYLKSDQYGVHNVWLANPDAPGDARQITFTELGVFDFAASPDGRYIVYTETDFNTGVSDLVLLDLRTGSSRALTNCAMQDSSCTSPVFRPDGQFIAYERVELNTGLGMGTGPRRIWLLDMTTSPATTYQLFEDSQILGYGATWSQDGTRIAFYDSANSGILIYDFLAGERAEDGALKYIPTSYGDVGTFSPDGRQMIFPEMVFDGAQTRAHLQMADLESGLFRVITDPNVPVHEPVARWSPNGQYLAVARTYNDERYTRGAQIYLMNLEDDAVSPLIFDERYANGLFTWNPEGTRLALQRLPVMTDEGYPEGSSTTEVWTYNLETRQLVKIDEDARSPQWVP
jgi:Tol biopolymer transport system component